METTFQIRPALPEDIQRFYGEQLPMTLRAYVIIYEGEIACVAGIKKEHTHYVAFSDVKPGLKAPKKTIYRAAREIMQLIKEKYMTQIIVHGGNARFLMSLGFKCIGFCSGEYIYVYGDI